MSEWLALGGSIVLGASAQIFLKRGLGAGGARRRWVAAWAVAFAVATALWFVVLRRAEVSWAYPLLGFSYVLVVLMAAVFLHERISGRRWLAILVISLGAALAAGSR